MDTMYVIDDTPRGSPTDADSSTRAITDEGDATIWVPRGGIFLI
jgi:hypothetical protein